MTANLFDCHFLINPHRYGDLQIKPNIGTAIHKMQSSAVLEHSTAVEEYKSASQEHSTAVQESAAAS